MTTSLAAGQIFANRYEVVRCIGSGGMGAVYEVIHLETERRRALKVMHAHFADSPDFRERFKREARVAAQIDSDYIVDVFDAGVDEATKMPFLAMELLRGEEISRTLRRIDRMSPPEVVSCLHQTALALDRTHKAGIVHRDLKPENLFLCERDDGPPQIKVLDFGIAKFATSAKGSAGQATNNVGTPLYMAPEQFQQGTVVTAYADIYALGLLAYTLLVGTDYWHEELERDENVFAFALIAMKAPIENASTRAMRVAGVTLSPAFDAWFKRVTAFTPEARYATATETVRELARALSVNLPAPSPTAASLQSLGTDVISPDWLIPEPAHLSRATPAGSATTMDLPQVASPKRRWKIVAIGGSVLVAAVAAWMLRAGTFASSDSTPVAAAAPVAAPEPTGTPLVAPEPAPPAVAPPPVAAPESKVDDPVRSPVAKAKAKKAAAAKAAPKPIYSRD
jgi:serine/threonine-protein kinase